MKRPLLLLAVVAGVVGAIILPLRRTGPAAGRFPASRAAELAPADATAFIHLPDLDRTAARLGKERLAGGLSRVSFGRREVAGSPGAMDYRRRSSLDRASFEPAFHRT